MYISTFILQEYFQCSLCDCMGFDSPNLTLKVSIGVRLALANLMPLEQSDSRLELHRELTVCRLCAVKDEVVVFDYNSTYILHYR